MKTKGTFVKPSRGPNQVSDTWFCALSAVAVFAAVMSTGPILEMGINDDWSYAYSALKLAQTGRLTYNGWSPAFLGLQGLWGAWVIRLCGFSFTVLRLSVLPFAMGCPVILFLLSRRLGLNARSAMLGTLTFSLSPLFIPLATSFMTDVPALFFMLLSLLAFTAALQSRYDRGYMAWLAIGTLAGIAGGTVRQIGYVAPLILIPVLILCSIRNRSNRIISYAASLWILSLLTWIACSQWQQLQPYYVAVDMFANARQALLHPISSMLALVSILSATTLFVLPVTLVYVASCLWVSSKREVGIALLLAVLLFIGLRPMAGPLIGNIVTKYGILKSGTEALGLKPVVLPRFASGGSICVVYLSFACTILRVRRNANSWLTSVVQTAKVRRWEGHPAVFTLFPFSVAYITALVFFAGGVYDRYVLPLLAVFVIAFLRSCQSRMLSKILAAGYLSVLLFGLYAVATTHDYLAAGRARVAAANCIKAAGLPRTSISAGWEYDAWTQLVRSGHVDLRHPVQGFRLPPGPEAENYWLWNFTPDVQPKYFIVYSRQPGLIMAAFPHFRYTAWLPPFHREVLVQMLPIEERK